MRPQFLNFHQGSKDSWVQKAKKKSSLEKNGKVAKIGRFRRNFTNIALVPGSDPGTGMVHGEWKLGTKNLKGTTHHSLTPEPSSAFMIRNHFFGGDWPIIVNFQTIVTTSMLPLLVATLK